MSDVDRRKKNRAWVIADEAGRTYDEIRDGVIVAVLMDLRDELQKLNALLGCSNFIRIPATLDQIVRNTTKRKYTKRVIK